MPMGPDRGSDGGIVAPTPSNASWEDFIVQSPAPLFASGIGPKMPQLLAMGTAGAAANKAPSRPCEERAPQGANGPLISRRRAVACRRSRPSRAACCAVTRRGPSLARSASQARRPMRTSTAPSPQLSLSD